MRIEMKILAFLSVGFLFYSCGDNETKVCEPGLQQSCDCVGGGKGAQVCQADGQAWGLCDCPCQKDCTNRVCGDDPVCGESCGVCEEGMKCTSLGKCVECEYNNDCANLGSYYYCDLTTNECVCAPACNGKCCGDDGCGGNCENNCPSSMTCNVETCLCEGDDCCPGQDLFITVDGVVVDLASRQGVQADVAALAPLTALSGDINTHVADASAAATGAFHFDCFDVSTVSLGLMLLTDDLGFDGADGDFFPTITGIAGYSDNTDKVCEDGATAMVINNQMQAGLDQIPGLDKTNSGYIIGVVMDKNHAPLEGATVVKGDGSALEHVLYPNADFTAFDGTATSANGVYLIPTFLGLTPLMGVKDGYTWANDVFKAATVPGAAYFVPLVANE